MEFTESRPKDNNWKILPTLIILICVWSILENLKDINYYALVISILGIIGSSLYLKTNKITTHLIELWLIGQIPYIVKFIIDPSHTDLVEKPIVDSSQILKLPIYFHMKSAETILQIGINLLPLIVFGLFLYLGIKFRKEY